MTLKFYKPVTPGTRGRVGVSRVGLWSGSPFKALCEGMSNTGGRNSQGRITSRHRVSKHRKVYRNISFSRKFLDGISCQVVRIEYDPNRNAHIALLSYYMENIKKHCYIIAPEGIKAGDVIQTNYSGRTEDLKPGNCMRLRDIPNNLSIHCLELKIGKGASLARSAGTSVQILGNDEKGRVLIRLASGETKAVHKNCTACIGVVSNSDHANIVLGKAGASFNRGRRPHVRGIAMNPVDHPNGGRANGGTHFASPTGVCAKGYKTRRNKRTSHTIIKKRSK